MNRSLPLTQRATGPQALCAASAAAAYREGLPQGPALRARLGHRGKRLYTIRACRGRAQPHVTVEDLRDARRDAQRLARQPCAGGNLSTMSWQGERVSKFGTAVSKS